MVDEVLQEDKSGTTASVGWSECGAQRTGLLEVWISLADSSGKGALL